MKAIAMGIKIVEVCPILGIPQGNWLKIGIKGGKFWYEKMTKQKAIAIKISDIQNEKFIILSEAVCLKNSFIN